MPHPRLTTTILAAACVAMVSAQGPLPQPPGPGRFWVNPATYTAVKVESELEKSESAGYRQFTCYLPGETAKTIVTGGGLQTFISFRFETVEEAQKSADKMLERLLTQKGRRYATGEYVPLVAIPYGERVFGIWADKKRKDPGRQAFVFRANGPLPPGSYAFSDSLGMVNTAECQLLVEAFTVTPAPAPVVAAQPPTALAPVVVPRPSAAQAPAVVARPQSPPAASNPAADPRAVQAAAVKGDALAQLELGQLYAAGRGVLQDYLEAHRWLNIAAARLTGAQQELAAELRDAIAPRMTPAQIADAQRLAREWMEQFGKAERSPAETLFKSGDLPGAVAALTKEIAADPKNVEALTQRGFLHMQLDDADAAIADFTQAAVINPLGAGSYALRGAARHRKGDLDGAILDEVRALALDSKLVLPHRTMTLAYWEKVYPGDALSGAQRRALATLGVESADNALRSDPNDVEMLIYKGLLTRVVASLEADLDRQKALLDQANALNAQAQDLRTSGRGSSVPPLFPPRPPPPPSGLQVVGGVPPAPPTPSSDAVRVGGAIDPPKQTVRVEPVYPAIAQTARVTGAVILEAVVDEQGNVVDTRVLKSVPLLDQAAIDAAKQWKYVPTLLNGVPVKVILTTTLTFSLK